MNMIQSNKNFIINISRKQNTIGILKYFGKKNILKKIKKNGLKKK